MLRQLAYPAIDAALSPFGMYATYELTDAEFVTHVRDAGPDELARRLRLNHYEPVTVLAALKKEPGGPRYDSGSLRRVDPAHPRRQWHVHLFDGASGTAVYSHYEYRPDLTRVGDESVREAVARLREHYQPTWGREWDGPDGVTYVLGSTCDYVGSL